MSLRLTVVGSGDAFNAAGRSHSCYLLEGEGVGPLMIDFGATALAALRRVGRRASELEGLAVTHLHGDHIGGTPFLLIDALFADRRARPLRLVGPVGLEARLRALLDVTYGADILERPGAPELVFDEIAPGERASLAGFEIEGFPADHQDPPERPLCLRLQARGRVVAFSGDTELGAGLLAAAAGADLVVAECSGLAPPIGRHCTWADWSRVLPGLDAQRVLLSHLGADVRAAAPQLLAERLSGPPGGPRLDFADDGLVIEV